MPNPWMDKPGPLSDFMREMWEENDRQITKALVGISRKVEAIAEAAGEAKGDTSRLSRAVYEDFGTVCKRLDALEASQQAHDSAIAALALAKARKQRATPSKPDTPVKRAPRKPAAK